MANQRISKPTSTERRQGLRRSEAGLALVPMAGALIVSGVALWLGFALFGAEAAALEPIPKASEPRAEQPAPPAVPAVGEIVAKTAAPVPLEDPVLVLPDGTRMPSLNGVRYATKMVWDNPEWSPIVRTEQNGELDWYVHADGSYSTTMMVWRSDLGREDAVSHTLHPIATAPVLLMPPKDSQPPGAGGSKR